MSDETKGFNRSIGFSGATALLEESAHNANSALQRHAIHAQQLTICGWSTEMLDGIFKGVSAGKTIGRSANPEARCGLCPLSCVQAGVAVRIKQLCTAPEIQNRLREIGLCEDQIIKLITNRNNFICQVCNARLALSEHLARLILVEFVLPEPLVQVPCPIHSDIIPQ